LPYHPNALTIRALLADGSKYQQTYYSVGGGFVINEDDANNPDEDHASPTIDIVPYPFNTAAELLEQCREHGLSISELVLANECHYRNQADIFSYLDTIWEVMQDCVTQGCKYSVFLPAIGRASCCDRVGCTDSAALVT